MIGVVLTHMGDCGCSGTLIAPHWQGARWQGAPWWPLLYPKGLTEPPASFVSEVRELGSVQEVMEGPGMGKEPTTYLSRSRVMAFRIAPPRNGGD